MVVHGYSVLDVSKRLGITNKSLYDWIKKFSKPKAKQAEEADLRAEIEARSGDYPVRTLCRAMDVHPSRYYAWLLEPCSVREKMDQKLTAQIKQLWLESGGL